jgi:hypothetical protein
MRCKAEVWSQDRRGDRCNNDAKRDGWCGTHHPDAAKRRRERWNRYHREHREGVERAREHGNLVSALHWLLDNAPRHTRLIKKCRQQLARFGG